MNEWVNEWMLLPALKHFSKNWLVKIIKRRNPPTHHANIKILDLHKNKNVGVASNDLSMYRIQQFFSIDVWVFMSLQYWNETVSSGGYYSSLHTPVQNSKSSKRSSNLFWMEYRKSLSPPWEVPILEGVFCVGCRILPILWDFNKTFSPLGQALNHK